MRNTKSSQVLNLQVTEGLTVEITPNKDHEFTLPTKEVARGYGVSESSVRSNKYEHSDELIEGKHFLVGVRISDRYPPNKVYWTKAGIIRLGFFIKSEQAKIFRTWAENLILDKMANLEKRPAKVQLIESAAALVGSQNKLAVRLGISRGELSFIKNGKNIVSQEAIDRTERICKLIIKQGTYKTPETFEMLLRIDNKKDRLGLYQSMKAGGIL